MAVCENCKFYYIGICSKKNYRVRGSFLGCEDYAPKRSEDGEDKDECSCSVKKLSRRK